MVARSMAVQSTALVAVALVTLLLAASEIGPSRGRTVNVASVAATEREFNRLHWDRLAADRAVERVRSLRDLAENATRYGPLCSQGGSDPCTNASTCLLRSSAMPPRWHVTTQELLIKHLRSIWSADVPRTMLDLGCQAGHGPYRNTSDALLWLDAFHAPGSLVVGVDAFEDYALDLQHRFDHAQPYASMSGVEKRAVHAAVGRPWSCKPSTSGRGCNATFNLDIDAAFTYLYCSRTDWKDHFAALERHNITDHSCRITRQRAGLSLSTLPLPPSSYAFSTHMDGLSIFGELPGLQRYRVPVVPLEELWRTHLRGRHIDLLKADVDIGWHRLGEQLAPLMAAKAFSLLLLEIDRQDVPSWSKLEQLSCALHEHGYALLLKVPCSATPWWSQRARYVRISGDQHAMLPEKWGLTRRGSCEDGGGQCAVQDVIAIEASRSDWIARLLSLGDAECAALTGGANRMPTELEMPMEWLARPPVASASSLPVARCLPDGSWSCGRPIPMGESRRRRPSCFMNASSPPTCKALWA